MTKERKVRVRWDRIGMTALAVLSLAVEIMVENYPAVVWCTLANLMMVLLFREQDRALNAMETAVKCAMIIKALTDGDTDGDTTTQP